MSNEYTDERFRPLLEPIGRASREELRRRREDPASPAAQGITLPLEESTTEVLDRFRDFCADWELRCIQNDWPDGLEMWMKIREAVEAEIAGRSDA